MKLKLKFDYSYSWVEHKTIIKTREQTSGHLFPELYKHSFNKHASFMAYNKVRVHTKGVHVVRITVD